MQCGLIILLCLGLVGFELFKWKKSTTSETTGATNKTHEVKYNSVVRNYMHDRPRNKAIIEDVAKPEDVKHIPDELLSPCNEFSDPASTPTDWDL